MRAPTDSRSADELRILLRETERQRDEYQRAATTAQAALGRTEAELRAALVERKQALTERDEARRAEAWLRRRQESAERYETIVQGHTFYSDAVGGYLAAHLVQMLPEVPILLATHKPGRTVVLTCSVSMRRCKPKELPDTASLQRSKLLEGIDRAERAGEVPVLVETAGCALTWPVLFSLNPDDIRQLMVSFKQLADTVQYRLPPHLRAVVEQWTQP